MVPAMHSNRPALCHALPDGLAAGVAAFEIVLTAAQAGQAATPPEWIQLTPRGAVTARDGRPFVFDPETLAATFAEGGLKIPVDFEHESEFTVTLGAKPARAWIEVVEARPEGLFGKVDWLPDAVAALAAKSYRYISPTFYLADDRKTARLIKAAALVSAPALGMPAVASAQTRDSSMLKDLLAQLGLAETASATDAIAAITGNYVPKAQHEATLLALAAAERQIQDAADAAQAARCTTLIEDAVKGGKIAPAAKDQYLALAKGNYEGTKAAIDAMPVVLRSGETQTGAVDANGAASDAVTLGARARAYMDEQAAKGISITATEAVAHVQGAAK
jgi:sulfur carrier protein ThiS